MNSLIACWWPIGAEQTVSCEVRLGHVRSQREAEKCPMIQRSFLRSIVRSHFIKYGVTLKVHVHSLLSMTKKKKKMLRDMLYWTQGRRTKWHILFATWEERIHCIHLPLVKTLSMLYAFIIFIWHTSRVSSTNGASCIYTTGTGKIKHIGLHKFYIRRTIRVSSVPRRGTYEYIPQVQVKTLST